MSMSSDEMEAAIERLKAAAENAHKKRSAADKEYRDAVKAQAAMETELLAFYRGGLSHGPKRK